MRSLYRTLSFRYLSRRWLRTGLIALSIALGVATLVATQAINGTMAYAAVFASNPTSGFADLIVSNGDMSVPLNLEAELAKVPGVAGAQPRVFANAVLPEFGDRQVLVLGIDVMRAVKDRSKSEAGAIEVNEETQTKFASLYALSRVPFLGAATPVLLGRELFQALPAGAKLIKLQRGKASRVNEYAIAGPVDATGDAAALAGYVVGMDLASAARLFELPAGEVHRFDLTVEPGTDVAAVRRGVEAVLRGRAQVHTFDEQSQTTQNLMSGMQSGFALCGLAALTVGLFLVYNALVVTVTERRHEIGILLSLGATRAQVLKLFAGEAIFLGAVGSLLGLPLGLGLAHLGLGPMREVMSGIFLNLDAQHLSISWKLFAIAFLAGVATTLLAALKPAFQASRENPAEAVRKVLKAASGRELVFQIASSVLLIATGIVLILLRKDLPARLGTLGGMCLMLIGGLLATPFFSALMARSMQPFIRRFLPIEWRLGADNIVRSPGRTGLVIGALAAGVSLVVQTAGVIRSNRISIREWIDDSIGSDLIVTSGSPVGAAGQTHPLSPALIAEIRQLPEIESALPVRIRKVPFRGTQVLILTMDAGEVHRVEGPRLAAKESLRLYRLMDETPGSIVISENLAALHGVHTGDVLTLPSPRGEVRLTVLGAIPDYSWNHGSVFLHARDYLTYWNDRDADVLDLYLRPGSDPDAVKRTLLARWGAPYGLHALTREDLHSHIEGMVESVYGVAYAQLIVVMLVAGLGMVTALLISVLQRGHEMGLLRAIGASRGQVIHSVLAEACLMGVIGTWMGLLVGVPLQWYVLNIVMPEEAGFAFPVYLPWREALLVAAGALLTAVLAGLGPAIYAVRQRIPDTIAYE